MLKNLKRMTDDEAAMTILGCCLGEICPGLPCIFCCGPIWGWLVGAFPGLVTDLAVLPVCTGACVTCLDTVVGGTTGLISVCADFFTSIIDAITGLM